MDDLLHYLSREIAMDGDDGTPARRLDSFLHTYYERQRATVDAADDDEPDASTSAVEQNIDAPFKEFVWRQLVDLPTIRVAYLRRTGQKDEADKEGSNATEAPPPGTPQEQPDGDQQNEEGDTTADVTMQIDQGSYNLKHKQQIKAALQDGNKKVRDARLANSGDHAIVMESVELAKEDIKGLKREDLLQKYGEDNVRLAADPETCFVALTGSHERNTKLTHLSYQILQAIARGREEGKTVVELGQEFSHDQKSLFHFVKNLVEMNLIIKMKVIQSKSQTNRCIHRHYLETSDHWKTWITRDPEDATTATKQRHNDEEEDEDASKPLKLSIITSAHLNSNEPLIISRIVTALRNAPDHTLLHSEMLYAIGFQYRPPVRDCRRFNRLIQKLVDGGTVEKVAVTSKGTSNTMNCLRLVQTQDEEGGSGEESDQAWQMEQALQRPNLLLTVPLERQMMDLLIGAGAKGLTVSEMRAALGDVNNRTLETALARFEKTDLPPHLCDCRIQSILETEGREKRLRWFTVAGYQARCRLDGLQDLPNTQDFSHPEMAGSYSVLEATGFYASPDEWFTYAENEMITVPPEEGKTRKKKTAKPTKNAKPPKKAKPPKDPSAPPRPRGRPRKPDSEKAPTSRKTKAKAAVKVEEDGNGPETPAPPPKKRGRPKKVREPPRDDDHVASAADVYDKASTSTVKGTATQNDTQPRPMTRDGEDEASTTVDAETPKTGGRAGKRKQADTPATHEDGEASSKKPKRATPKSKPAETSREGSAAVSEAGSTPIQTPKIRGRPRKYPPGTTTYQRRKLLEAARAAQAAEAAAQASASPSQTAADTSVVEGLETGEATGAGETAEAGDAAEEAITAEQAIPAEQARDSALDIAVEPPLAHLTNVNGSAEQAAVSTNGEGEETLQESAAEVPENKATRRRGRSAKVQSAGEDHAATVAEEPVPQTTQSFSAGDNEHPPRRRGRSAKQLQAVDEAEMQIPQSIKSVSTAVMSQPLSEGTPKRRGRSGRTQLKQPSPPLRRSRRKREMPVQADENDEDGTQPAGQEPRGEPEELRQDPEVSTVTGEKSQTIRSPKAGQAEEDQVGEPRQATSADTAEAVEGCGQHEDEAEGGPQPGDAALEESREPGKAREGATLETASQPLSSADAELHDGAAEPIEGSVVEASSLALQQDAVEPALPVAAPSPSPVSLSSPAPVAVAKKAAKAPERYNYSLLVHENDLHALLQELGGVIDEGPALTKAYLDYQIRKNPEKSSQHMLDKRTYNNVMKGLEGRGLAKRSTLQIQTSTGKLVRKSIIYLADLDLDGREVRSFVRAFEDRMQTQNQGKGWLKDRKVVDLPNFDGSGRKPSRAKSTSVRPSIETSPRAFFETEWRIVSQAYGWQFGPFARAKTLHRYLAQTVTDENDSSSIISSDPAMRIFSTTLTQLDMPFSTYMQLSPCFDHTGALDLFLAKNDASQIPVRQLPDNIADLFHIGRAKSAARMRANLEILVAMNVLVPLEPVEEKTDFVAYSGLERDPRYFRPCTATKYTNYWLLANKAPIYNLRAAQLPSQTVLGELPLQTPEQVTFYWETLHSLLFAESPPCDFPPATSNFPAVFPAPRSLRTSVSIPGRWTESYLLLTSQRDYIRKVVTEEGDADALLSDTEKIQKLAHNVFAPLATVKEFVELGCPTTEGQKSVKRKIKHRGRGQAKVKRARRTRRTKIPQTDEDESSPSSPPAAEGESDEENMQPEADKAASYQDNEADAPARETARNVLARKAKESVREKENIWQGIIQRFTEEHGTQMLDEDQLEFLHNWFMSPGGLTVKGLQDHLATAVVDTAHSTHRPSLPIGIRGPTVPRKLAPAAASAGPSVQSDKGSRRSRAQPLEPEPMQGEDIEPVPIEILSDGSKKTAASGWTEAEDDQLRDFYVIVQARANHLGYKFHTELFRPYYPGCSGKLLTDRLRRLATVFEEAPYLDALQEAWNEIWLEHGGTPLLPESDLHALAGYDLGRHRRFLVSRINKQAVRFESMTPEAALLQRIQLPKRPDDLLELYKLVPANTLKSQDDPRSWDYLWSTITTAQKNLKYLVQPFSMPYVEDERIETPDLTSAQRLELFKQRHDFNSTLPKRVLSEAASFEKRLVEDKAVIWPLVADDGDMLVLAHLFSDSLVELELDTTSTLEARPYTDYKTRKTDDDTFENELMVTLRDDSDYYTLAKPLISQAA